MRRLTCARRVCLFRLPVENPISSAALGRQVMNKTVNAFQHIYIRFISFFFFSSSFSRNFHITQLSRRALGGGEIPNTPSAYGSASVLRTFPRARRVFIICCTRIAFEAEYVMMARAHVTKQCRLDFNFTKIIGFPSKTFAFEPLRAHIIQHPL